MTITTRRSRAQQLRTTPVGSVCRFSQGRKQKKGVLITPVHTAASADRIAFYVPGEGRKYTTFGDIQEVVSTPYFGL